MPDTVAINTKHLNAKQCAYLTNTYDLGENQIDLIKEIKSPQEVEGMIECHKHDGAALVSFLAWLEEEVLVNKSQINEFQAAEKAEYYRQQ